MSEAGAMRRKRATTIGATPSTCKRMETEGDCIKLKYTVFDIV